MWELERRGWLPGGLYGELLEANREHHIPMPDLNLSKTQYAGEVDRAIFRAALTAVKTAVQQSTKLQLLRHSTRYGSQLNDWHNLDDIKLVARAKLSCLPEFGADWGRAELCECGARDTFVHAADEGENQDCDRYGVAREAYPDRLICDVVMLHFTKEIIQIREL